MLDVVNFVPKPTLEIQAVEFKGGSEYAAEVINWVELLGGSAEWYDADPGSRIRCGLKEHIRIIIGSASMFVYVGDYIMQDEDGRFKPLPRRLAELKYQRVDRMLTVLELKTESELPEASAA